MLIKVQINNPNDQCSATAVLWNNLPVHLTCAESVVVFKKQLKTHLFYSSVNQFLSDC